MHERLDYSIHSCSSYSGDYVPSHLLSDKPQSQNSRWSANSNAICTSFSHPSATHFNGPLLSDRQWVLLEFQRPSVIRTVKFGKYCKPHPCNVREFRLYGAMTPSGPMSLLYQGSLKNDTIPETFEMPYQNEDGIALPIKFLRIEPINAHSSNYNLSLWHVAITGSDDSDYVADVNHKYEAWRDDMTLRLTLAHLRRHNLMEPFHALCKTLSTPFEAPLLSELHTHLVIKGSYPTAEALLSQAMLSGLFDEYRDSVERRFPVWTKLDFASKPGPRGGHQLIFDAGTLYLYGGWDGTRTLNDLWSFKDNSWTCISKDVSEQGGPSPHSCHKMCVDEATGEIYLLGNYSESTSLKRTHIETIAGPGTGAPPTAPQIVLSPSPEPRMRNDFWRLHTRGGVKWELLSEDVASDGGPALIFDHQMVIDSDSKMIHVFGGKFSGSSTPNYHCYSRYDVLNNVWSQPKWDNGPQPRNGHSMLLSSTEKKIYIMGGQRNDEYLSDIWTLTLDGRPTCITSDYSDKGGPDAAFTQRATLNEVEREMWLYSGVMRDRKPPYLTVVKNAIWVRKLDTGKWYQVSMKIPGAEEPASRYAHQFAFDHINKVHYLFGGNPADDTSPASRLGDFWKLELQRPSREEILRTCKYFVRRQQFYEMCRTDSSLNALTFLQTTLSSVVNHSNAEEAASFRSCMSELLSSGSAQASPSTSQILTAPIPAPTTEDDETDDIMASSQDFHAPARSKEADRNTFSERTTLFEVLCGFFPKKQRMPSWDLKDAIGWKASW